MIDSDDFLAQHGFKPSAAKEQPKVSASEQRNAALEMLARREHSRRELKQKLQRRFGLELQTDELLDALAEQGLQCDTRFTESYTRMRKRKGYGPIRIVMELRERGVAGSMVNDCVYAEDHDWFACAGDVWQKKFGTYPVDQKERAKQMRFLQYRGFDQEHIREVFAGQ